MPAGPQLARQQSDERWQQLQRQVALWDLEEEWGDDLDGDGVVGQPGGESGVGGEAGAREASPPASTNPIDQALRASDGTQAGVSADVVDSPPAGFVYYDDWSDERGDFEIWRDEANTQWVLVPKRATNGQTSAASLASSETEGASLA